MIYRNGNSGWGGIYEDGFGGNRRHTPLIPLSRGGNVWNGTAKIIWHVISLH